MSSGSIAHRPNRDCRSLLGSLILLLVLFPFLDEMARPILLIAVVATVFVAGVIVVRPDGARVRYAKILAAIQIGLTGITTTQTAGSPPYAFTVSLALATTTVLIVYCIYCVLGYVLQANYITRDQIYAGICAYLMMGFAFGSIYHLIELLAPGCFFVSVEKLPGNPPDLMYFSFVTLATLGYGDITPVAKVSRVLAELEALVGTLYIAVFMSRLVSLAGAANRAIADSEDGRSETNSPLVSPASARHEMKSFKELLVIAVFIVLSAAPVLATNS